MLLTCLHSLTLWQHLLKPAETIFLICHEKAVDDYRSPKTGGFINDPIDRETSWTAVADRNAVRHKWSSLPLPLCAVGF